MVRGVAPSVMLISMAVLAQLRATCHRDQHAFEQRQACAAIFLRHEGAGETVLGQDAQILHRRLPVPVGLGGAGGEMLLRNAAGRRLHQGFLLVQLGHHASSCSARSVTSCSTRCQISRAIGFAQFLGDMPDQADGAADHRQATA